MHSVLLLLDQLSYSTQCSGISRYITLEKSHRLLLLQDTFSKDPSGTARPVREQPAVRVGAVMEAIKFCWGRYYGDNNYHPWQHRIAPGNLFVS